MDFKDNNKPRCGICIWSIKGQCVCDTEPCKDYETYDDWDNLDELLFAFFDDEKWGQ